MKQADLGYVAGIIDGEGSIHIVRRKEPTTRRGYKYELQISVGNTQEWLIRWLHFNFGGYMHVCKAPKKGNRDCWHWSIRTRDAVDFLKLLLPYLKLKRPQAELALQFQGNKKMHGHKTDEEWAVEEAQTILMHNFNTGL